MKVKIIGIAVVLLLVMTTNAFSQRRNARGTMSARGTQGSGGDEIIGEIQTISTSNKSFEMEIKNKEVITVNINEDTNIVHTDDIKDVLKNNSGRGRQKDILSDIDTEGMTEEEKKQALKEANEEQIAKMEKEIEAIAIDFSELEKGDDVRVQMSSDGENVARLIVLQ